MERVRILVVADSAIPVPPQGYGGTERIVSYLIDDLATRGYQVTLMGARGSRPPGRLVTFSDARSRSRMIRGVAKLAFWSKLVRELPRHDLVHSVMRLDYLWPALRHHIPKVLHFENPIFREQVEFVRRYAHGPVVLAPVGVAIMKPVRDDGIWRPVHNAIPVQGYGYAPQPALPAYVTFLGRLTPNKGAHIAIRVARQAGMKLVIGGNIGHGPEDQEYFERHIRPQIDGQQVEYIGEVDDARKAKLLGGAVALINPIQWDDPCPLVPLESLACGTPVLTFARGELPYLIRHGVTGFLCADETAMVQAIEQAGLLSRKACRREAESRFDVTPMVDKFEEVYKWLMACERIVPSSWEEP